MGVSVALTLVSLLTLTHLSNSAPSAISLEPSQYWDGNDGPWSSFQFSVGTPAQSLRLLPATGQSGTWPIVQDGCSSTLTNLSFSACQDERGGKIFMANESSTWNLTGTYYLTTLYVEPMLGVGVNARARFGTDKLRLSWPQNGLATLNKSVVGGIADTDFWIGTFGLSSYDQFFETFNDDAKSTLTELYEQAIIPSKSWAYTAGAYNHEPSTYGSLTIGGYDTTRFESNNIWIGMGDDISRDLLVAVQRVETNLTSTPLLSTANFWFIDSLVASMWFPESVCDAFADAYGLQWDGENSIYLINDTQHETLLAKNPTLTFTLAATQSSNATIEITIPYVNLALNASSPFYPNSTRYFPLNRAANTTSYTLGRAFLQNAHVIANYDNSTFNVAPALFPDNGAKANVVSITNGTTNGTTTQDGGSSSSGLSGGAKAGIAVGVVAFALIVAAILGWFLFRRRKQQRLEREAQAAAKAKEAEEAEAAAAAAAAAEAEAEKKRGGELDAADNSRYEVQGDNQHNKAEMGAGGDGEKRAEMAAGEDGEKRAELFAPHVNSVFEMAAEPVDLPLLETPENGTSRAELEDGQGTRRDTRSPSQIERDRVSASEKRNLL
ncbi:aspartic peptidase domain-containing protein [Phyllosticta citriasiana]|uniref:Aspartic peptidase domain-containing protein n=1 Tax=Phyllosticta citriasiana TaxID=595635 RepID=A0ABR1KRH6_9PEZI